MAISSINFQKPNNNSTNHMNRISKVTYLLDHNSNENELCSYRNENEYLEEAKIACKNFTKRNMQKSAIDNFVIEALVNLNKEHSIVDVEDLFADLQKEYGGFEVFKIAVHKDEGVFVDTEHKIEDLRYDSKIQKWFLIKDGTDVTNDVIDYAPGRNIFFNEDDEKWYADKKFTKETDVSVFQKWYNYHAHIRFTKFDMSTGKNVRLQKSDMQKIQTITAKSLNMTRGEIGSKAKRMNHHQLKKAIDGQREAKLELKVTNAKVKDLKSEVAAIKRKLIESQKAEKEHYAALRELEANLKSQIKDKSLTIEDMQLQLDTLNVELTNSILENHRGNEVYQELQVQKIGLEEENKTLKNANKALQEQNKTLEVKVHDLEEKTLSRPNMNDYEAILSENETLKEENFKLEKKYNTNFEKIVELNKELDAAAKTPTNLFSWIKTKFEEFKEQILGLETENTKLINKIKALELENRSLVEEVNKYKFQLPKEELDAIDLESDYFKSLPQEQQKVISEQIIENFNKKLEQEKTLSRPSMEELSKEELAELQEEAEEYKKSISKEDISKASQELRKEINENKGQELSI